MHETNHACEHGVFTAENHCHLCDPWPGQVRFIEEVTVVPGAENGYYVCITDDGRPERPRMHAWSRAALHCWQFKDLPFFIQVRASKACRKVADALFITEPRPPRVKRKWNWMGVGLP
jgi:hypothetical protein